MLISRFKIPDRSRSLETANAYSCCSSYVPEEIVNYLYLIFGNPGSGILYLASYIARPEIVLKLIRDILKIFISSGIALSDDKHS